MPETLEFAAGRLRLLDQRRLPFVEAYLELDSAEAVAEAIRAMVVRGAPAIGVAAAWGLALAARAAAGPGAGPETVLVALDRAGALLVAARPTAVNLAWAVRRVLAAARAAGAADAAALAAAVEVEAGRIDAEDRETNRRIGRNGAALLRDGDVVLTHCNAGALATAGYGTALGVIRAAAESGKRITVFADETRPFLQGSRLTAFELVRAGIPVTVITDGMAGHVLRTRGVRAVIVGADRIAANGDTANKVGTYGVAVLARENGIPLYVAAPRSTIDLALPDGDAIPIEERDPAEVASFAGVPVVAPGAEVYNPAFDVTPARYVTAIVTEAGIARPPFEASLREAMAAP